jgi:hypothetical protein
VALLDLNGIRNGLKTILDGVNTTTAGGLSYGLSTKVAKVLTVNPERIPVQANYYPYVTIYTDAKVVDEKTISRDQLSGRRRAELDIKIVGVVQNFIVADPTNDEASDEAEILMENIEEILRSYTKINGLVDWQYPTGVTYHNIRLEEETSVRAGLMNLRVVAHY